MMIPVIMKNGTRLEVFPKVLDEMLAAGQIMFFKRSSGWVVVGRDQVRRNRPTRYGDRDRRGPVARAGLS
jgi:hypothetical protein